MNEKYRNVCEKLDWEVYECDDGTVELEKYSPAGEDFSICIGTDNFVDNVKEYADSFDQEEHIEMWVLARHTVSGVPSVKELVKDAEAIDEMLQELAAALTEVEDEEDA